MTMRCNQSRTCVCSLAGLTLVLWGSLVSLLEAEESVAPAKKPNVVLIVADDLGYRDLACYGAADVPTPNLDELAQQGTRFTDAYATYVYCSPSRAAILTGRYQQRFGFDGNVQFTNKGLPVSEKTLAATLKHYGYATALIGKWHLGSQEHFHPLKRGFDEFYGHLEGMRSYYPNSSLGPEKKKDRNLNDPVLDMRREVEFEGYITDVFSDRARDFIRRKKDQPFFVALTYNAPHTPIEKQPAKYLGRIPEGKPEGRRRYAACVNAIDEGVGNLVSELKSQGVFENTMIFFVSDHGGVPWANHSSNGELYGFKDVVYEGGIRIPFIFHYGKGEIDAGVAAQPVSTLDIFSTVMAAVDPTYHQSHLDGLNLLQKNLGEKLEERPLYWSADGGEQLAIRIGQWKLIQLFDYQPELYQLSQSLVEDPKEGVSLAQRHRGRSEHMLATLRTWANTLPQPTIGGPRPARIRFEPTIKILRMDLQEK